MITKNLPFQNLWDVLLKVDNIDHEDLFAKTI